MNDTLQNALAQLISALTTLVLVAGTYWAKKAADDHDHDKPGKHEKQDPPDD